MELVDDPAQVPEGYEADIIWDGLGLLPYMIAPHYRSEHPESSRIDELVRHFIDSHTLFRALRDGEAIVVDGDRERIVS
jgi:dipeptidase E